MVDLSIVMLVYQRVHISTIFPPPFFSPPFFVPRRYGAAPARRLLREGVRALRERGELRGRPGGGGLAAGRHAAAGDRGRDLMAKWKTHGWDMKLIEIWEINMGFPGN